MWTKMITASVSGSVPVLAHWSFSKGCFSGAEGWNNHSNRVGVSMCYRQQPLEVHHVQTYCATSKAFAEVLSLQAGDSSALQVYLFPMHLFICTQPIISSWIPSSSLFTYLCVVSVKWGVRDAAVWGAALAFCAVHFRQYAVLVQESSGLLKHLWHYMHLD